MNNTEYSKIWESYNTGYPVDTWEEGKDPQMTWDEYFGVLNQILGEARVNLSELKFGSVMSAGETPTPINEAQPGPDINALVQQIQTLLGQVQQAQQAQQAQATATPAGGQPPATGPQQPGLASRIGGALGKGAAAAWQGAKDMAQGAGQAWNAAGTPPAADTPPAAGTPPAPQQPASNVPQGGGRAKGAPLSQTPGAIKKREQRAAATAAKTA